MRGAASISRNHPFALHFLFEDSESLVDIVFANEDLHGCVSRRWLSLKRRWRGLSMSTLSTPGRSCEAGRRGFTKAAPRRIFEVMAL